MKMLSSDEFDRRFDSGEEIEEFVDWSQKPIVMGLLSEPRFSGFKDFQE